MKDHGPLRSIFPNSPPVDAALNLLREEMKAFTELYLNNMNKIPNPLNEKEAKPKAPEKKVQKIVKKKTVVADEDAEISDDSDASINSDEKEEANLPAMLVVDKK